MLRTYWAIVRSRSGRWYHVSRVVEDPSGFHPGLWEMYWHPSNDLRGPSKATICAFADDMGIELHDDVHRSPPSNTQMNRLELENV